MPHSLFLAQNHIRTVCTREQFAARALPGGLGLRQGGRRDAALRRAAARQRLPALLDQQTARPGRRPALGRDPHRRRGPDRPRQTRRHPHLLRQPPRRPDRPLHDDPARRPPRPAAELLQHLQQPAAGHGQRPRPEQHRRPLLLRRCAASARRRKGVGEGRALSEIAQKGNLRVSVSGKLAPKKLPRRERRRSRSPSAAGSAPPTPTPAAAAEDAADRAEPPRQARLHGPAHLQVQPHPAGLLLPRTLPVPLGPGRQRQLHRQHHPGGPGALPDRRQPAGLQQQKRQEARPLRPHLLSEAVCHLLRDRLQDPETRQGHLRHRAERPPAQGDGRLGTSHRPRHDPLPPLPRTRARRHSFISSGCPAPRGFPGAVFPLARTSFAFDGGTKLSSTFTSTCKVRGR